MYLKRLHDLSGAFWTSRKGKRLQIGSAGLYDPKTKASLPWGAVPTGDLASILAGNEAGINKGEPVDHAYMAACIQDWESRGELTLADVARRWLKNKNPELLKSLPDAIKKPIQPKVAEVVIEDMIPDMPEEEVPF